MKKNKNLKGYIIWEIQDNGTPKKILSKEESVEVDLRSIRDEIDNLDLNNKTYAIRIGKKGLQ